MKPLLSSRTLQRLVVLAARAMTDTGTIVRPTVVSDGGGGTLPGPDSSVVTPCTFAAASPINSAGQLDWPVERGSYRATVPLDADVRVTDSFVRAGVTYEIRYAPVPGLDDVERTLGLEER